MPTIDQDAFRARRAFTSFVYETEATPGGERWYRPLNRPLESDQLQDADEMRANQLQVWWPVKAGRALPVVPESALIGIVRATLLGLGKDRPPNPGSSQSVPPSIQKAIDSSRSLLALEEDWDDQGSPGYSESTWQRAADFLIRQATFAQRTADRDLPVPDILPGPRGSIDLHWKAAKFELLVNIPQNASQPATFYGDDYGAHNFKGSFDPAAPPHSLALWLLFQG